MPQTDPNPAEGARGARFAIEPGRAALVVVDMQNCFVADSPIAAPLGAQVAQRLNRLAAACRQAGMASGFAEVVSVDEVLSRIPVAASV